MNSLKLYLALTVNVSTREELLAYFLIPISKNVNFFSPSSNKSYIIF